nr:hypothetical protein [Candidatus Sigynarchaeota archaeon]
MQNIFGEYNQIYFIQEDGIKFLCDRAHRKKPVRFEEEHLLDLSSSKRKPGELSFLGSFDFSPKSDVVEISGNRFRKKGVPYELNASGFGRGLRYQAIETESDRIAALLIVELPPLCQYRIHWDVISHDDTCFHLPEGIIVT